MSITSIVIVAAECVAAVFVGVWGGKALARLVHRECRR